MRWTVAIVLCLTCLATPAHASGAAGAGAGPGGVLVLEGGMGTFNGLFGYVACTEVFTHPDGTELRFRLDPCLGTCIPEYDVAYVRLFDGGTGRDGFAGEIRFNVDRRDQGDLCSVGEQRLQPAVGDFTVRP